MSEQGIQFKTGFLAPNIDYGAIGRNVAEQFANPILAVAQERAAQRDAKMKALNPQAAAGRLYQDRSIKSIRVQHKWLWIFIRKLLHNLS